MKLHLIIYIALTALLASCENEIPYNPGNRKPLLIMNALMEAEQAENYVYLDLSTGNGIEDLSESTLTLYVNGEIAETPRAMTPEEIIDKQKDNSESTKPIFDSMRNKRFRLTTVLHPGDHVRLEATAEHGKYHVSSEVTVPYPVDGLHVDTCIAYLRENNSARRYQQYKITLQDRPNEKNHYRLDIINNFRFQCQYKVYATDEDGRLIPTEDGWGWVHTVADTLINYRLPTIINREDIILTDGNITNSEDEDTPIFPRIENKYNIFTDSRFSNSSATLKVYTPLSFYYYPTGYDYSSILCKQTITIRILSISDPEYRYLRALNSLDDEDYDNALMEPVSLPTNVEGGLGFVSVSSESKFTIEFPERYRAPWE